MGDVPAPRRRRRAVRPRLLRRSEGRAARGAGAQVVGRAAMGGRPVITSRVAYAAAHVICDPQSPTAIDWEATLAYRRYLWSLGLGVAEAMDTAQRGMGLDWKNSFELILRSIEASRDIEGAVLFSGAGTDQLAPSASVTLAEVVAAYEEQCEAIEGLGGRIVLMASRALAACARSPDDYQKVYSRILSQVQRPVIIHWLGEMFDPQLTGYWGEENHGRARDVSLAVIRANRAKVDGIKISLLDRQKEIDMRARLPEGVRMFN